MTTPNQDSVEITFEEWWTIWRKGYCKGITNDDIVSDMNSAEGAWQAATASHKKEIAELKTTLDRYKRALERIEKGWHIMESDEQADIARTALQKKETQ